MSGEFDTRICFPNPNTPTVTTWWCGGCEHRTPLVKRSRVNVRTGSGWRNEKYQAVRTMTRYYKSSPRVRRRMSWAVGGFWCFCCLLVFPLFVAISICDMPFRPFIVNHVGWLQFVKTATDSKSMPHRRVWVFSCAWFNSDDDHQLILMHSTATHMLILWFSCRDRIKIYIFSGEAGSNTNNSVIPLPNGSEFIDSHPHSEGQGKHKTRN